jgi:hypothetical protein
MVMNPMAKRRHKKRKMTAKQLEYFGKGRKRKHRSGKRAKKAAVKIIEVKSNPTRGSKMAKRKHRRRHHRRSFKSNPIRRRFRRNPLESGFLANSLGPAAMGAAGAVMADYLQSMLPIFVGYQSGLMGPLVQIGYSLLVGWGVDAVAGPQRGAEAAAGGITLAFYNLFNGVLGGGGIGAGYGAPQGMARYLGYLQANPRQLQAVNARRQLRGLQPINMRPGFGLAGGQPVGVRPLGNPRYLGNTGAMYNRQRNPRGPGGLGWMSPARNLSRYVR